jgi:cell division protein FtsA
MEEIKRSGYENILPSGLVLTGGCTNLEGICEIAEEVTGMPVKRGLPQQKIGGLGNIVRNPTYSTAIGLLLYGLRLQHDPYLPSVAPSSLYSFKNYVSSLYRRVAAFFA